MSRISNAVQRFCLDMDMKLAVVKTVVLSYGTNQNAWKVSDMDPDIEASSKISDGGYHPSRTKPNKALRIQND